MKTVKKREEKYNQIKRELVYDVVYPFFTSLYLISSPYKYVVHLLCSCVMCVYLVNASSFRVQLSWLTEHYRKRINATWVYFSISYSHSLSPIEWRHSLYHLPLLTYSKDEREMWASNENIAVRFFFCLSQQIFIRGPSTKMSER